MATIASNHHPILLISSPPSIPVYSSSSSIFVHRTSLKLHPQNPTRKTHLSLSSDLLQKLSRNNVDPKTLASALDDCTASLSFQEGTQIHARIVRLGLSQDVYLSSKLLFFYCRHGVVDAARMVFDSTPVGQLNQFFWNTLVRAYVDAKRYEDAVELFVEMLVLGFSPNEFTYPFVLKSCSVLWFVELAREIHGLMVVNGYVKDVFAGSALLDLYVKFGCFGDACKLFDRITHRNEVTWNSMVSGYAQNGYWMKAFEALELMGKSGVVVKVSSWNSIMAGCIRNGDGKLAFETLRRMLVSSLNVKPNAATFNTLLPVMPTDTILMQLKELHGFVMKQKEMIALDVIDEDRLRSSIASGYASHGCMHYASRLFDGVSLKTSQLWISMISGFIDAKQSHEAFRFFREMIKQYDGEFKTLSRVPLTLLLPECDPTSTTGSEIHAHAYRVGFESNTSVNNALISMYAKRGNVELSERVFLRTPEKDVISWNTMISSHAFNNDFERAFDLFHQMHSEGEQPDEFTFSSVLNGCGEVGAHQQGVGLHGYMIRSGHLEDCLVVQNSLLDMYGKCGCIEEARKLFDEMSFRDDISWNTIVSGYGVNALPHEAFSLFYEMQKQGWKPNRVTFISLLSACSHAGLVDEGLHFFHAMTTEYGITPDVEHYSCIIDNLGRAGRLDDAYNLIKSMPIKPDDCVWGALLGGCRIHGNIPLAEVAAKHLIELKPQHSGYHLLLSNIYSDASRWKDAAQVWSDMKDMGVKKFPGYSWIEVDSEFHTFLTGDNSHKHSPTIYFTLNGLTEHLFAEGYSPSIGSKIFSYETT